MNHDMTLVRRVGAVVGGLALALAAVTACHSAPPREEHKDSAPATTLNPLGPNSFSPQVKAPGPRTALPGNVRTG